MQLDDSTHMSRKSVLMESAAKKWNTEKVATAKKMHKIDKQVSKKTRKLESIKRNTCTKRPLTKPCIVCSRALVIQVEMPRSSSVHRHVIILYGFDSD